MKFLRADCETPPSSTASRKYFKWCRFNGFIKVIIKIRTLNFTHRRFLGTAQGVKFINRHRTEKRMKTTGYLLLLGLLASSPGLAATSPLVGTWILEKSED